MMIEQTLATAARVAVRKRGKPWRAANKLQVYQVMRRLFDLAIKPGRLRRDNPVSTDLRPRKDAPRLYSFLYPDEFVRLISCTKIPLARRVYYVIAVYTGLRTSSLSRCTWFGFDFVNNTIMSLVNKNKVPQIFAQIGPRVAGARIGDAGAGAMARSSWVAQVPTLRWCQTSNVQSAKRLKRFAAIFGSLV